MSVRICISEGRIDTNIGYEWLTESDYHENGAVVTFTGKVRSSNNGLDITRLRLEHYPGMADRVLNNIVNEACSLWPITRAVVHRIGDMFPRDKIVFVGTTSTHRSASFHATEMIINKLKSLSPFWKYETSSSGSYWLS